MVDISNLNTQREIRKKVLLSIEKNSKFPKGASGFFKSTFIHTVEGNKIIVGCDSESIANILKNNFKDLFLTNVASVTGTNFDIVFVPLSELNTKSKDIIIKESEPLYFKGCYLNPDFTFERFVEGPCNREARQAGILVGSNLGKMYNPFYIQGDSGLGKTHLLHAIGHFIRENFPEKKVLCISAQNFFDEYINFTKNAINDLNLTDYLKNFDVLLIDDIQQLKGKEKTLDYFFDIYTYFINNNRQVVLTSDRPQNELVGIPDRLITRFLQGLTVSILKPDFSTCKQILLKKIEFSQLDNNFITDEAIDFIAENYSDSIRQLEGILTRLTFYTTINNIKDQIDLNVVFDALNIKNVKIDKKKKTDASKICSTVADYYSISIEQLTGTVRKYQVALARQISIYLIRTILDIPYAEIGKLFSNRDHSTIIHSITKVEEMLKTDTQLISVIDTLKAKLI